VKIIGLGKAGCRVAAAFGKFPQYEVYGIDTHAAADVTIKARATHEEYEKHFPSLKRKFKFTNEEVCVITCGVGAISGGVLRLLEQLQHNHLRVIYIQPDLTLASEVQQQRERIVRNVLQEYARSGLLETLYLIDNLCIEQGIGEVAILGYYDVLNQAIVNTMHMINVFRHTEPVIGNFVRPAEISRIATLGILDIEKDEEKWFYDLTGVRDVIYYYGINEEDLKEDGTLFRTINDYVKAQADESLNVSYGVFKTTYEQKYCYCLKYTSMVQSYKELLDD
tara:strand:+ start:486 stop:1325 length:840 start_codon:yes stop_codon:yes gene_type:complete